MKKRVVALTAAVCLSVALTACGKESQNIIMESEQVSEVVQPDEIIDNTKNVIDEEEEAENNREEVASEGQENSREEVASEEGLTFKDLSARQFYFSSGVGAWGEEFTIEKDGYFTGKYHDSEMGESGEEYPEGTVYSCVYSGYFTDVTKVGEYIYEIKLKDISYKNEPGEEEILDGIKSVYTESYFMGINDSFRIYLPGMPMDEISEELYWWVKDYNQSESELTMVILVNETEQLAAASVNRPSPVEDAQRTYDTYKESYDYWEEKLAKEAQTTLDMVIFSEKMYEVSDECLNYLWNLIRYNVPEDRYEELLKDQRAWITEKEEKGKKIEEEYEGGSLAKVDANMILAQLTIERCVKLVEYLK